MAVGRLPWPGGKVRGIEIGPCLEPCKHTDCASVRRDAESACTICGKPIGYEVRFYSRDDGRLDHADCVEDQVEAERKARKAEGRKG